jgi:hypothetical protein
MVEFPTAKASARKNVSPTPNIDDTSSGDSDFVQPLPKRKRQTEDDVQNNAQVQEEEPVAVQKVWIKYKSSLTKLAALNCNNRSVQFCNILLLPFTTHAMLDCNGCSVLFTSLFTTCLW